MIWLLKLLFCFYMEMLAILGSSQQYQHIKLHIKRVKKLIKNHVYCLNSIKSGKDVLDDVLKA